MAPPFDSGTGLQRPPLITPDELVVHLREAGAKRVYIARDAFRDGVIPITATYEVTAQETARGSGAATTREMLRSVFEAIGERLWFHDREWTLDGQVEPAFTDPPADVIPLYDRGVEQKYGKGFNLRNLLFVYETYREQHVDL